MQKLHSSSPPSVLRLLGGSLYLVYTLYFGLLIMLTYFLLGSKRQSLFPLLTLNPILLQFLCLVLILLILSP